MNYWIFVSTPQQRGDESYGARAIYQQRMRDGFWGLGERTPNRRNLRSGDMGVFYVGRPECVFAGSVRLASDAFVLNPEERSDLSHGSAVFTVSHGVRLEAVETWENPPRVAELSRALKFIQNPEQWGVYFQGGVRQVTQEDYQTITSASMRRFVPPDLRDTNHTFALETHLEEFIERNWTRIPWGCPLQLYRQSEQSGRQFPAGTWSIDFLAVDQATNEFVIIELKRAQTSDDTVGQILRYMSWVREHMAESGQKVRGIIVAGAVDDALRYAVKGLADISTLTYSVSFSLNPVVL